MLQPLPVLFGKLGVDGEQGVASAPVWPLRKLEGVLDGLLGCRLDAGVPDVLLGREHLLELLAELELADDAARFDVGENPLQIADAGGELLHLAQTLLDLAEVGRDLAEGFGEARLQRGVQLFVDGDAHLLELGGVVVVEFASGGLRR